MVTSTPEPLALSTGYSASSTDIDLRKWLSPLEAKLQ